MNRPNFPLMTDAELRAYILGNREDKEAFYAYVDRMSHRPPIAIIEPEDWSEERMQQVIKKIEHR
ncbi:DUF6887 family protein [Crocosphaera sp. XPORK-15E]|uniref:DUF6887 family protein n=1 Tax=Crocosphaera sp. XPORK-15E TaxID=3110247 RepID=UPI002B219EC2|nr:hypothetical protein [Crocosphaera sp. XPORK-15E]MEA5534067.1 hypothetical protein [Crocosphaera sp. XPORK-15E]